MPKGLLRTSKILGLCVYKSLDEGRLWKFAFVSALLLFLFPLTSSANNLAIANVALVSQNTTNKTINVNFDISWSNSWRDGVNYDAAWVFIKYSTDSGTTWSHATLKNGPGTNISGYVRGSGTVLDIVVPTDEKGCFIQRSGQGSGAVSTTGVQIVWDYNQDGLSDATASAANTRVKVFAIEMVYVPQGAYSLGDGSQSGAVAPSTGGFMQASGTNCRDPIPVQSEAALSFTASAACGGNYYTTDSGADDAATGAIFTLPGGFPKGYQAFYMMKYEISHEQYRDFLNTLTRTQQSARVASVITADNPPNYYVMSAGTTVVNRQNIRCPASGNGTTNPIVFGCDLSANGTFNESADGLAIAMNYLEWQDLAAYAAWAGLRPMTEMEFEKAARGPSAPTNTEYAWGSTSLTQAANITNGGQITEYCTTANVNAVEASNASVQGPMRVGALAQGSTTTRATTGGSFYGAMDMSGNLREIIVGVGTATGRTYIGTHGTGALTATGNASNADWPGFTNGEVSAATGTGVKGGDWSSAATYCRISDRQNASTFTAVTAARSNINGGRCVRTANS